MSETKYKMGPHDKGVSNTLFPGQHMLGKLITSASAACGLANTRTISAPASTSSPPSLLRLNSQGESSTEDDFSAFPSVEPTQDDNMAKSYVANGFNPMWGLPCNQETGLTRPVAWNYVPKYTGYYGHPHSTGYADTRYSSPQGFRYLPHQRPPLLACPPPMWHHAYQPNFGPSYYNTNGGVFQFGGQNTHGYRAPVQGNKCHTAYKGGHKQNRKSQSYYAPCTRSMPGPGSKNPVKQDTQDVGSGQILDTVNDVTQKICRLDISSECESSSSVHADSHVSTSGPEPTVEVSLVECSQDQAVSPPVNESHSTHISNDYINTELSLVADLCSDIGKDIAQRQNGASKCQQDSQEASTVIPTVPKSANKCDTRNIQDLRKPEVRAACIVLAPKTQYLNRKKKGRPSSKKRHRHKLQQCTPGGTINDPAHNRKKRRTEDSKPVDDDERRDSMSFVIDFSESDFSEAEPQCGNSPKAGTSPITAKFSWVLSAGDLSDEDTTDSEEFSDTTDSDFDVECFSPFTLQITCITNPPVASCKPTTRVEDEVDGVPSDPHGEEELIDADSRRRLDSANNKWWQNYGQISMPEKSGLSKVYLVFTCKVMHIFTRTCKSCISWLEYCNVAMIFVCFYLYVYYFCSS